MAVRPLPSTIVVGSGKGGAGKTTATVDLALALSGGSSMTCPSCDEELSALPADERGEVDLGGRRSAFALSAIAS